MPYLSLPRRGIIPTSEKLHSIFNYILYQLDTGCQWEKIPIKVNESGKKEIHHVGIVTKSLYCVIARSEGDPSLCSGQAPQSQFFSLNTMIASLLSVARNDKTPFGDSP
ncbi:MAG: hypothetical protein V1655_03205 [bacterium]